MTVLGPEWYPWQCGAGTVAAAVRWSQWLLSLLLNNTALGRRALRVIKRSSSYPSVLRLYFRGFGSQNKNSASDNVLFYIFLFTCEVVVFHCSLQHIPSDLYFGVWYE